jgi:hypothetical protein
MAETADRKRAPTRVLSLGSIVSRTFGTWMRGFVPISIIALVLGSPQLLLTQLPWPRPDGEQGILELFVEMVVGVTFGMMISGAIAYAVFQRMRGRPAPLGACLSIAFRRLGPLVGTGLLAGLLTALGFVALIVPGIMVFCMLYVAVPAAVVEGTGPVESLKRSALLTAGNRWIIFALFLVIAIINGLFVGILSVLLALFPLASNEGILTLVGGIVGLVFAGLPAVANAVTYHDLRTGKEGVDVEDLVKVFE